MPSDYRFGSALWTVVQVQNDDRRTSGMGESAKSFHDVHHVRQERGRKAVRFGERLPLFVY